MSETGGDRRVHEEPITDGLESEHRAEQQERRAGDSAAAVLRTEVPRIGAADVVRHGGTHRSGACDPDRPTRLL